MTMNKPQKYIGNKPADTLRAAIENEGKWVYYLASEGLDRGLDPSFACDAMTELGEYYAGTTFDGCEQPAQLAEKLMNRAMECGHEAEIQDLGAEGFDLVIRYCPMLNMWDQLSDDRERKEILCDAACSMYSGLGKKLGFDVGKACSIAHGCDHCRLSFRKA